MRLSLSMAHLLFILYSIMADNGKTIFLVEDDESFLIIFTRWLEEAGYEVVSARTAGDARQTLDTIDPPALFWLDYYLGSDREDGMSLFQWLRDNPSYTTIPVIVVSITVNDEKLKEFERAGVRKAFSKILSNKNNILQEIGAILGKK